MVIALSCIIFSAISSSPPAVDTGASVVTAVWTYVGELAFNLLVLVGASRAATASSKKLWDCKEVLPYRNQNTERSPRLPRKHLFRLNTRQFICSVLAVGVAVGIFFALQPYVGTEEIGWMCILGAAPFAACGFFTYHA